MRWLRARFVKKLGMLIALATIVLAVPLCVHQIQRDSLYQRTDSQYKAMYYLLLDALKESNGDSPQDILARVRAARPDILIDRYDIRPESILIGDKGPDRRFGTGDDFWIRVTMFDKQVLYCKGNYPIPQNRADVRE